MRRIYLDHVSTTPIAPDVLMAMLPWLGARFANPSSPHRRGIEGRAAVEQARSEVGALVGAAAGEILFTGSASEANNLAVKGIALARRDSGGHLLAAATEHISVLHPLRTLERAGFRVGRLPVDGHGRVDPDALRRALRPDTLLVSVAHASAEIGTLQDLPALCRVARERGVPFHCDATVTAGAVPIPRGEEGPDLVTMAPHLFYGPQGVGALRVRTGLRLAPLIEGGSQEGGLRAGTEPVAAIVGFAAAARLAAAEMARRAAEARRRAERLRAALWERLDGLHATGDPASRLPGHLSLCARGIEAEALLNALDACGIEAASGSACTTEVRKASHVLEAIGVEPLLARGAVTFSFGEANEDGDAPAVAEVLPGIVRRLREISPLPAG